jgi:hypothetical protein
MNNVSFPLAISQSKATRLKLEDAYYAEHGTITGMQDFEFRAIPIKADSEDERFENTLTASTLFDLADRIGCSEQGLREKFRAAYKQGGFTARYKGFVVTYNENA